MDGPAPSGAYSQIARAASISKWTLIEADHRLAKAETPYGPLVKTFQAEQAPTDREAAPPPLLLQYACPLALMWMACQRSEPFFDLLQDATSRLQPPAASATDLPAGRLCIYFDHVTPGNVHRADKGRKYMAVYWTLLDLPLWLLQREEGGWFVLAFVPYKTYKKILGAEGQLLRLLLKTFFPENGCSFLAAAGAGAVMEHGIRVCLVRLRFCCWLADGDAFPKIGDNKSTSGTKPCPKCKNVLGRCTPEDIPAGSNMVHFSCGDPTRFQQWSADELIDLQRHLAEQAAVLGDRELEQLEQRLGYKYAPHGLLASDMAAVAKLPDSIFMDWMHTLVSSGGIAQYELNQFLRRLLRKLPTAEARARMLSKLDDFAKAIAWPSKQGKWKVKSFQERLVDKPGKPLKMFSTECLQAIIVTCLFVELQPAVQAALPEETRCVLLKKKSKNK